MGYSAGGCLDQDAICHSLSWVLLLAHFAYWAMQHASWDVIPQQPREVKWLHVASTFLHIWWIEWVTQLVAALAKISLVTAWLKFFCLHTNVGILAVQQDSWDLIPQQPRELAWLHVASTFLHICWMEWVTQAVATSTKMSFATAWFGFCCLHILHIGLCNKLVEMWFLNKQGS
jgi:hypothetical protein